MGSWNRGMVGWWDSGMVGSWDGGIVESWDGGIVGWWAWDRGMVESFLVGKIPASSRGCPTMVGAPILHRSERTVKYGSAPIKYRSDYHGGWNFRKQGCRTASHARGILHIELPARPISDNNSSFKKDALSPRPQGVGQNRRFDPRGTAVLARSTCVPPRGARIGAKRRP